MAADAPPYIHLEIATGGPFSRVIEAEQQFSSLINDVASDVLDGRAVVWNYVTASTDAFTSFRLTPAARGEREIAPARLHAVVDAIAGGLVELESDGGRPHFFSDTALVAASALAGLREDLGRVGVMNGSVGTELTTRLTTNVDMILGPRYEAYGSAEGRIEGLNIHDRYYFNLYDDLTGKRIRCNFAQRIPLANVRDAVARRVAAYGLISYRSDGQPISMRTDHIDVFPVDGDLPTISEVYGILGDSVS